MSDQNPPPSSGGFSMDPKEAKANAKAQEAHAKPFERVCPNGHSNPRWGYSEMCEKCGEPLYPPTGGFADRLPGEKGAIVLGSLLIVIGFFFGLKPV